MSDAQKFHLSVMGEMNIDGKDHTGAFLRCDPAALRGIAPLFGDEVAIVHADRIAELEAQLQTVLDRESATHARHDAKLDALEAQVAAADRLADAGNRGLNFIENTESEMGEPLESGNALRTALAAYLATKEQKA